jgi:hypothetical protein
MKPRFLLFSLLILSSIFLSDCKKKIQAGIPYKNPMTSFVMTSTSLPVYASPDLKAKSIHSLNTNSEFKILEHGIINLAFDKIRWFKVQQENITGYLSEQVLEKKEISTFEEFSSPEVLTVSVNSLFVRKNPSQNSAIISKLTLNSKVEALARGSNLDNIEDKQDYWVKVKTKDGKIGFCFNAFLIGDLNAEWNEEVANGFIDIKNVTGIIKNPAEEKLKEGSEAEGEEKNFFFKAKVDDIFPVKTKAIFKGKTYYSISESYLNNCNIWGGCEESGRMEFWIPSEDVEVFSSSLADYTFRKYGYENEEVFQYVKSKLGSNIDVRNISSAPIGENSEGISFFILKANYGTSFTTRGNFSYTGIIQMKNGNYSEIHKIDGSEMVKLHDFDKDGVSEIMLESSGRMSSSTAYYTIKNKKLIEILNLYDDPETEGTSKIEDDKVIYTQSVRDPTTGDFTGKTETTTYLYQNGKFIKSKG